MVDFVYGKDTKFKVYFNNNNWPISVHTWSIVEVAVEADDPVNGEDRDRSQKITKYYGCQFNCYEDGSSSILQNILAMQAAQDSNLPNLPFNGGVLFKYRDGTRGAFVLKDCTFGPMSMSDGGRTTVFKHDLKFKAKYFSQVPAV